MNAESPDDDLRSDEQIIGWAPSSLCEEYSDDYWSAVRLLQHRMSAALLEKMRELISNGNDRQRQFAADVLAQGRAKDKQFSEQCVQLLLNRLTCEVSPRVVESICHALGHHKSANAVAPVAGIQSHPDPNVRLAVVHALSCQDDPVAIETLISLSADPDHEVRNWATFGLGSMTEVDSIPLREALVKRLAETDKEIFGEALVGLALRGDTRVAVPLLKALNDPGSDLLQTRSLLLEAVEAVRAAALRHPNEAWQPILDHSDELGCRKSNS